jgi:hypothetical protein
MEWCIDAATTEENAAKEIREFEINFNHEALLGDRIEIRGYENEKAEIFFQAVREQDRKEIFSARLTYA